jgi:hypothetical protein
MNIYIHQDYAKEQARRAGRLTTIGMILIVISFLVSFASFAGPNYQFLIFLAYPFLLIGFPIWQMGRSTQRRLASTPRADNLLNAELKGLNNKYSLHHYIKYGETWIHHLLVTPSGLVVMYSSDATGPVRCQGTDKVDRWKSPTNLMDRLTGLKPPVGNPTQELLPAMAAAREILEKVGKPEVPVKGVVLFTRNPDVQIDGCSFQAIPMNEAKLEIRDLQHDMDTEREGDTGVAKLLTSDDRRRLNSFLAPEVVTLPPAQVSAAKKPSR